MSPHPLLTQQLTACTDASGHIDLEKLRGLIDGAYADMDKERSRARRTLSIMASEIEELARDLERRIDERTEEAHALRERFTDALEAIFQGILLVDATGVIVSANRSARQLLKIDNNDLVGGLTFLSLMARLYAAGEFGTASPEQQEVWLRTPIAGQPKLYVRVRPNREHIEIRTVQLADGSCIRTYTNVTERHEREQALMAAEREYRTLFDNSVLGIFRSSIDGRQLRANPALVRLNGFDSEAEQIQNVQNIGREWYVDPGRREEFKRRMIANGRVDDFVSEIYRHNTRERIWVSETAWTVRDDAGKALYFEGMIADATERVRAQQRVLELSRHDALTGLHNRRTFTEELRRALRTSKRRKSDVAVLCMDLDRFKFVNDAMGHPAGDSLLRKVAKRIETAVGKGRIVARLGGDEFAILIEGPDSADVVQIGNAIIAATSKPYKVRGQRCIIGASVGIAAKGHGVGNADDLMKMADIALYAAKSNGKGQSILFEDKMRAASERRQKLEALLRQALSRGEMFLVYQPIIDARTGRVAAYEALMRWTSEELGVVPPSEFIPVAEESGLLQTIGHWLVRSACATAAQTLDGVKVAVNVSPVQLRSPSFKSVVINALASTGLPPHLLELEITENALLADDQITLSVLNDLRSLGVRVALDDFGTGYASLSYLQKFAFDKIKIDRSFVSNAERNATSLAIIGLTVALAQQMNVEVVAEGVETIEERDRLIAAGCFLQQGYLHGRPAPIQQTESATTGDVKAFVTARHRREQGFVSPRKTLRTA